MDCGSHAAIFIRRWCRRMLATRTALTVACAAHPQSAHHRLRHRVLALPPRTRPHPEDHQQVTDPRTHDAPASRSPLRLALRARLRDDRDAASVRPVRQHSQPQSTDARWSHFKRPHWGHCKRPFLRPRWSVSSGAVGRALAHKRARFPSLTALGDSTKSSRYGARTGKRGSPSGVDQAACHLLPLPYQTMPRPPCR